LATDISALGFISVIQSQFIQDEVQHIKLSTIHKIWNNKQRFHLYYKKASTGYNIEANLQYFQMASRQEYELLQNDLGNTR